MLRPPCVDAVNVQIALIVAICTSPSHALADAMPMPSLKV